MKSINKGFRTNKYRIAAIAFTVFFLAAGALIAGNTGLFSRAEDEVPVLRTTYEFPEEDIAPYFDLVTFSMSADKDGYSSGGGSQSVRLDYNLVANEDALYSMSEQILINNISCPRQNNLTTEQWLRKLEEWFAEDGSTIRPIEFVHKLDDRELLEDIPEKELTTDQGVKYGSFEFKDGEMRVTLDPIVCFLTDVDISLSQNANINSGALPDSPTEFVVGDDGRLITEDVGKWESSHLDTGDVDYTISKTGPSRSRQSYIDYVIEAESSCDLSGTRIKDVIPDGMELVKAVARIDGGSEINVTDLMSGGIYTVPDNEDDEDEQIHNVRLTVTLALDAANYRQYLTGSYSGTFANSALLLPPVGDGDAPLGRTKEVKTVVDAKFVRKTGISQNIEGTRYLWDVTLNTVLPSLEYGYVVDVLSDDDHQYDFASGIDVTADGHTYHIPEGSISELTNFSGDFSALTAHTVQGAQTLHSVIPDDRYNGIFDTSSPHAYYYYYQTDDENDIDIFTGERKKYCVLILPYKNLQGTAVSNGEGGWDYNAKEVHVKYYTDLNMHGMDKENYWEEIEDYKKQEGNEDYAPDISNDVGFLWKNGEGDGDGISPPDMVAFEKDIDFDPGIIVKHGVDYDKDTRTASWKINVNRLGLELQNVKVTDSLTRADGAGNRIYVYDPDSVRVLCKEYRINTTPQEILETVELERQTGYSPGEISGEPVIDTRKYIIDPDGNLIVNMGDIPDGTAYDLMITGVVCDPELIGVQIKENASGEQSIDNTAWIEYSIDGNVRRYFDESSLNIPNALIEKTRKVSYDKETGIIKWEIDFGKEGLTLYNATIDDILPEGFEYVEGSAYITPAPGKDEQGGAGTEPIALTPVTDGTPGRIRFTLGEIAGTDGGVTGQYIITLETRATNEWIRDNLLYHNADGDAPGDVTGPAEVINTAVLRGEMPAKVVGGEDCMEPIRSVDPVSGELTEGITVTAPDSIPVEPIGKTGKYNKEESKLTWTVNLNDVHYDLAGCYLLEELEETMELVPDSIVIETIDSKGTAAAAAEGLTSLTAGDSMFRLDFLGDAEHPNTYRYRITFDTLLTADAMSGAAHTGKITNKVYLKDSGDAIISDSGEGSNNYDGSYDPNDDANPHTRPNLHLHKTSSHSTESGEYAHSDNSLELSGAVFTLDAYRFEFSDGVITVTEKITEHGYSKTASTDAGGDCYFGNIRTQDSDGTRLLHVISETTPPRGYSRSDRIKIVYFAGGHNDLIGDAEISDIVFDESCADVLDGIDTTDGLRQYLSVQPYNRTGWLTIDNYFVDEPSGSGRMQKLRLDWNTLGQETEAYDVPAGGVSFKITQIGKTQLRPRTLTADDSGYIDFGSLDPGVTYLVEEQDPPAGMQAGSFKLTVGLGEDGYTYTYEDPQNIVIDDDKIIDLVETTDYTFTKSVRYENEQSQPLSGVTLRFVGSTPAGQDGAPANYAGYDPVTSGDDGKVTFEGLTIGEYSVYEVRDTAAGYQAGTQAGDVLLGTLTVTQSNDGEGNTTFTKVFEPADNTEVFAAVAGSGVINNIPVKGDILLDKISIYCDTRVDEIQDEPLAGAVFGLYRKTGSQVGSAPVYTGVSDGIGHVRFNRYGNEETEHSGNIVEYGDYVLREIEAPAGYDRLTGDLLTITRDMLELNTEKTAFTYTLAPEDYAKNYNTGKNAFENKLHEEDITLTKVDDDHNPLNNIHFDVYRRGTQAVGANGEHFETDVPVDIKTYFRYLPEDHVSTDAEGRIAINDLPYGDYLLVEDAAASDIDVMLRARYKSVAVLLHVTGEGTNAKLYAYYDDSPLMKEQVAGSDPAEYSYTVDEDNTDQAIAQDIWDLMWHNEDIIRGTDNDYTLINRFKYGYLNMDKIAADRYENAGDTYNNFGSGGVIVDTQDGTTCVQYENGKLPHKRFLISRYNTVEEIYKPYLIAETDEEGKIHEANGGFYGGDTPEEGGRHLWAEEQYQIVEITDDLPGLGAAHTPIAETMAYFRLLGNDSDNGAQSVWFSYNGHDSAMTAYYDEYPTNSTNDSNYVNIIKRSSFDITKLGSDGKTLSGDNTAVFKLYVSSDSKYDSGDTEIATIACDGGEYRITPTGTLKTDEGIPYFLWENGEWKLLDDYFIGENKYVLYEETVPDGYLRCDDILLDITGDNDITASIVRGSPASGAVAQDESDCRELTITDTRIERDIKLDKYVTGTGTLVPGAVFVLYRQDGTTPLARHSTATDLYELHDAAGLDDPELVSVTTGTNGSAVFHNIPDGVYVIRENLGLSLAAGVDDGVYIDETPHTVEIYTDTAMKRRLLKIDGRTVEQNSSADISDDPMNVSLTLTKTDQLKPGWKLEGVEFTLYKRSGGSWELYSGGSGSGKYYTDGSGVLSVTGLGRGDYRLEETQPVTGYCVDENLRSVEFTVENADKDKTVVVCPDGGSLTTRKETSYTAAEADYVTNERQPGSVTLVKQSGLDDSLLNGVLFTLSRKQDADTWIDKLIELFTGRKYEVVAEVDGSDFSADGGTTDSDGRLTLDNLPWGTYRLTETVPADGHSINSGGEAVVREFVIGRDTLDTTAVIGGNSVSLSADEGTVVNDPNKVRIIKTDMSGAKLSGARFEVNELLPDGVTPSGTKFEGTTNGRGEIEIEGQLVQGRSYAVSELKAPTGYYTTGKKLTFTMQPDGAITVDSNEDETLISVSGNGITFRNELLRGDIVLSKRTASEQFPALSGRGLGGAEFGLYKGSGTTPYRTAVSDPDGTVRFTNIPYGSYVVRETGAPAGYTASDAAINITGDMLLGNGEINLSPEQYYTYTHGSAIANTLQQAVLRLVKEDADGNKLSGVTFDVYRRGDRAVEANGDGYAADAGAASDYYPYGPGPVLVTGTDGSITAALPYGDYLLTERPNGNYPLAQGRDNVALLAHVRGGSTTVEQYVSGEPLTYESDPGYYTVENTSGEGWRTLGAQNGIYTVVNDRRFGYINLNKTGADKSAVDGNVTVYPGAPLGNKSFTILRYEDGEWKEYTSVTTGTDGHIPVTNDRYGSPAKHLWTGSYKLVEETADGTVIEADFTVAENAVTWINCDGYETSSGSENDIPFVNFLERGEFALVKLDEFGEPLPGARFTLKKGSAAVASIASDGAGAYTITDNPEAVDGRGVPYIYDHRLLPGSYTLTESSAPDGYFACGDITVNVSPEGVTSISAASGSEVTFDAQSGRITVTDRRILKDIRIKKCRQDGRTPVGNIVFGLYDDIGQPLGRVEGTNDLAACGEDGVQLTAKTGNDGVAVFRDIPEGSYTIREELDASLEGAPDDLYIDTDAAVGVRVGEDGGEAALWLAGDNGWNRHTGNITVTDPDFGAEVRLVKLDMLDTGVKLGGVQFTLEKLSGNDTADTRVGTTDAEGRLSFAGLSRGDYRLTETRTVKGYTLDPQFIATFTIGNDDNGRTFTVRSGESKFTAVSGGELLSADGILNSHAVSGFSLMKTTGSGEPLGGAVFALYAKNEDGTRGEKLAEFESGRYYVAKGTGEDGAYIFDSYESVEPGELAVSNIKWGSYELEESAAPAGYVRSGEVYAITLTKDLVENVDLGTAVNPATNLRLLKTDSADSSKVLGGAHFLVTNKNDASETHELVTDENGEAVLSAKLRTGESYVLTETKAPSGYVLSSDKTEFTVSETGELIGADGSAIENNTIALTNRYVSFTFTKYGLLNESCADRETGKYDPSETVPLEGALFEMRKENDETVFVTASSGADGSVTFPGLPIGRYVIIEASAPDGYVTDGSEFRIEVTEDGCTGLLDASGKPVEGGRVVNDLRRSAISMYKVSENDKSVPVAGASYALYRLTCETVKKEAPEPEITAPDATAAEPDPDTEEKAVVRNLVCITRTDEKGLLKFDGLLYDTDYLIEEVGTTAGYYVSKDAVELRIERDAETGEDKVIFKAENNVADYDRVLGAMTWYEPCITATVIKKDQFANDVTGACLALYDYEGNKLCEWITDGQPHDISSYLANGEKYYLREIAAPDGYLPSDPIMFSVSGSKVAKGSSKNIVLMMTDPALNITLFKINSNGAKLTGSRFTITGRFSDGTGSKTVKPGKYGKLLSGIFMPGEEYTITETTAPKGYELLTESVTLKFDEKGVPSVNAAGNVKLKGHRLFVTDKKSSSRVKSDTKNASPADSGKKSASTADSGNESSLPDDPGGNTVKGELVETPKRLDSGGEGNTTVQNSTNNPRTGDAKTASGILTAQALIILSLAVMAACAAARRRRGSIGSTERR